MKVKGLSKFARQLMSRSTAYLMRWHHRAVTWRESVAEHHALTARMAYEMGLVLEWNGFGVRPEKLAIAAMYHDEEELVTGDMPAPAKKLMPEGVMKKVADAAIDTLWPDYPGDLAGYLREVAHQSKLNEMEKEVIEYADKLAAFSYVFDTVELGNQKMIDILDHISSDEYLKSMDWEWLTFLRKEWGLPWEGVIMCQICDDIDSADLGEDCCGGDCDCQHSESSCQPSTTAADVPGGSYPPIPNSAAAPAHPYNYPPIFDPLMGAGDTLGVTVPPNDPNYQLMVDTHDVMSPGRMDKLMREFFEHLMAKCQRKNKAYAETDATDDALNNFREAAAEHDISKLTYAMILQGKHSKAWKTFVRTGEAPDKAFRILGDIIVYAFIMYCIGVDEGKWKHEQEVLEDAD